MIAIDWVLACLIAGSALLGLMRGMIGVLASLAAWLLGGWAAFHFGAQVALLLASDGAPGAGQLFAGYALAFIVVMVAVGLLGWLLRKLVHSVGLSGVDRLLGLALGVARGAMIACGLLLVLGLSSLPREPSWQSSRVIPWLLPGAERMRVWLPDWVAAQVDLRGNADGPVLLSRDTIPGLPRPVHTGPDAGQAIPEAEAGPRREVPLPAPVRGAPSERGRSTTALRDNPR